MKTPHVVLYTGHCSAEGSREGYFGSSSLEEDVLSDIESQKALETVNKKLEIARMKGFEFAMIEYEDPRLVKNESMAYKLIKFMNGYCGDATNYIKLKKCMHGRILFDRILRLDGWRKKDKKKTICLLKKSKLLISIDRDEIFHNERYMFEKYLTFSQVKI
jgi:hypothetical protein